MKEMNIINIDINLIDPNPDNAEIFNMDSIQFLAKGIEEEGFYGSIEVFQKPDGRYEISSGHRRYEAMKLLKRDKIPCTVIHSVDNVAKAKRLLSSNLKNRILKPMDFARAIRYYKDNVIKPQGIKAKNEVMCVEYFNMSISSIKRYEALLKLIPELQKLTDEPEFPYSAFSPAATLSEVQQRELYHKILSYIEESDTKNISGLRIVQMIDSIKIRDNYKKQENGITKKTAEVTSEKDEKIVFIEKQENDLLSNDTTLLGNNLLIDIGNSEAPQIIDNIEYLDRMLEVYTEQINTLLLDNYQIKDKKEVAKNIDRLKISIHKLENLIKK